MAAYAAPAALHGKDNWTEHPWCGMCLPPPGSRKLGNKPAFPCCGPACNRPAYPFIECPRSTSSRAPPRCCREQ